MYIGLKIKIKVKDFLCFWVVPFFFPFFFLQKANLFHNKAKTFDSNLNYNNLWKD